MSLWRLANATQLLPHVPNSDTRSELYLSSDAEQVMVTSTVHIGLAVGLGIGVAALQFM